ALSTLLAAGTAFAADTAKPDANAPAMPAQPGMSTPTASAPSATHNTSAPSASEVTKVNTATGIVKSFDAKTGMLTLMDDQSFKLDKGVDGKDLKASEHVALTYKTDGGKKIVTDFKVVDNPSHS